MVPVDASFLVFSEWFKVDRSNHMADQCYTQIILGSIVTRCPSMSLAPSALVQLDSACDLFSKTAKFFHAEKVLVRVHHHTLLRDVLLTHLS